ncbi:hypothetical protein GLOIN_2v1783295 [Rhizophagus clarus]|uniref:Actin-like ATPase domain-containing protein n=1 Tax=Rhizophagus clarus TaxID=94130 RepID=A0A8H3QYW5_9GLOM|nr:hypothetical protein GLOIN_2v1783295 [Rhizophagus clarus]
MSGKDNNNIRVVATIDFGTNFSGYAYAHKSNPEEIIVRSDWENFGARFKTPTIIKYKDDSYTTIKSWGYPALIEKPKKKKKSSSAEPNGTDSDIKRTFKPIELFKLHLLESLKEKEKPFLPDGLDFKNIVKDFMKELSDDIREILIRHWQNLDFYNNVLVVLTVPAEFDDKTIETFRECALNAGFLKDNLRITTEPEAAAIYYLDSVIKEEHELIPVTSFVVVDCGDNTVDLTTFEVLEDETLGAPKERMGDYCGSGCVDQAFLKFIGEIVGTSAIESVKENHHEQLQYFVQEFCKHVKIPFTGIKEDLQQPVEFDLEEILPAIQQYVKEEERSKLEESEWLIEINFEDIKGMFDPTIDKIIHLIRNQLEKSENECPAIFLIGGFSESKYLQSRIREEFDEIVPSILVPPRPIASVVNGGILYGFKEIKK